METRKAPRIDINFKVLSKPVQELKQKFALVSGNKFEVKAVDISEIGIGLVSEYFLPKGLILELEIDGAPFDLKEVMKIKGEIRYCRYERTVGYRCGVQFLDLSEVYRKAIAEFISTFERRKEPRVKLAD